MARLNRNRPPVVVSNKKSKMHVLLYFNLLLSLGILAILAKMNGWI